MLAAKRSAGVAPEVNLHGHVTCVPMPSVNKAAHSGFETEQKCHEKSKAVAPQKRHVLQNKFFKKSTLVKVSLCGSFTLTVNFTIYVSGTFHLFNVMCKQHHRRSELLKFLASRRAGGTNRYLSIVSMMTAIECLPKRSMDLSQKQWRYV